MKLSELIAFVDDPSTCEILYQGHKVTYLNEAGSVSDTSVFYVAGHEFGATHLVHVEAYRGDGFEAAWEVWIDNATTIDTSEVVEAYRPHNGSDSYYDLACDALASERPQECFGPAIDAWIERVRAKAQAMLSAADDAARNEGGEYPELIEGYEYQSNASGTGIVDVGHYAWMNEADPSEVEIIEKGKESA